MFKVSIYGVVLWIVVMGVTSCVTGKKRIVQQPANTQPASQVAAQPVFRSESEGSYNYGDRSSATLTLKAWRALEDRDLNAVVAYTNKCIQLYAGQAARMQKSLSSYPTGKKNTFSYWALNDVATCLYIQGEALRRVKRMYDAQVDFERITKEFSFGQCYDPRSDTFWKLTDGAHDSMYMINNNLDLYYGDMTSSFIVNQMWQALNAKNVPAVIAYDMTLERLYRQAALNMEKSLKDYPTGDKNVFKYWALNDVGTGMFILGEAHQLDEKYAEARNAYNKVNTDYHFAQCWDPQGWFWKPAEAALDKITEIQAVKRPE
jgi:tetratricopeptide (TPR) repeat protein